MRKQYLNRNFEQVFAYVRQFDFDFPVKDLLNFLIRFLLVAFQIQLLCILDLVVYLVNEMTFLLGFLYNLMYSWGI